MQHKFITILLGLCLLLAPSSAIAAEVAFQPSEHLTTQANPFTTTVTLNTQGENINAVEGIVVVNPGVGKDITLSDSGSVVTYWVTRPVWDANTGVIRFSGGIPGGYTGGSGILFSIILPPHEGASIDRAITFSDFKAYKNDGIGSSASVTTGSFSLGDIAGQIDEGIREQLYIDGTRKDNIPPEPFSPQISRGDNAHEGKWVINFHTVDKQSGIDHYEIQETQSGSLDSGKWITASNPYVLQDQNLHSFVYVIAVDRQGNERIIKVSPRNPLPWTKLYGKELIGIALLAVAGGAIYYRRRLKTNKKKKQHSAK
jgi:hypothetical protein